MKKRIIGRIVLLFIVISSSFTYAFYLKGKMTYDYVEGTMNHLNTSVSFPVFIEKFTELMKTNVDVGMYDASLLTFQELESMTDCVVLATKEYSSSINGTVLTKFTIEDVLKGEMVREDYFYMFEPIYFKKADHVGYHVYSRAGGYIPTLKGETYLLYINRIEGYDHEPVYLMSSCIFSKLPIKDSRVTCFWEDGVNTFHLDELRQYMVRFPNEAMAQKEENLELINYCQEYINIAKQANIKYFNRDIEIKVENHRIY